LSWDKLSNRITNKQAKSGLVMFDTSSKSPRKVFVKNFEYLVFTSTPHLITASKARNVQRAFDELVISI